MLAVVDGGMGLPTIAPGARHPIGRGGAGGRTRPPDWATGPVILAAPVDAVVWAGMVEPSTDTTPGVIEGRYRPLRSIGRGGMGTVWLAEDLVLSRSVAMKQIGAFPGESDGETRRALREARAAAALNHPHVVGIYDAVEYQGTPWLVMEYVPGPSLRRAVEVRGGLTPIAVADVGADLAHALAAAHRAGIVHRDLTPSNVLVGGGTAKIGDFGIARRVEDDRVTETGLVTGTPNYMAPEVAQGHEANEASDVWSLGAVLYFAVEGRDAYPTRGNALATLRSVWSEMPGEMERAGPLAPVISSMLAGDPSRRPTAEAVSRELSELAALAPATTSDATHSRPRRRAAAAPGPSPAAPSEDLESGRRRGVVPLIAIALAALLGFGSVAVGLGLGGDDSTEAGSGMAATRQEAPASESPGTEPTSPTDEPATGFPEDEVTDFLTAHFSSVTRDPSATWESLTPQMREVAGGRQSYDSFWRTIERVTVSDVSVDPDTGVADLTLTYTTRTGTTSAEPKQITVIRDGGALKIDAEQNN